ncbi:hypothetical protein GUJ93_ZPchr0002g25953 [Zizania palustris]|uniref:Purple acid phosphatase C-terminal domain-containing protein n=1 Tax=Zizania palustris TaxID=103762 RepID=A0A8J5VR88_ZIZPA|nr:hypothetical protein GUJ93_ZPchr0002g25953 [Zizania palustris]
MALLRDDERHDAHPVAGGGGSRQPPEQLHRRGAGAAWSVYREMDYGFVKLKAFKDTSLLYEHKQSSDGKGYDS